MGRAYRFTAYVYAQNPRSSPLGLLTNLRDDQSLQVLVMDPGNAETKNTGSMSLTHGAEES